LGSVDLSELDGTDFRSLPFGERYARLARMLPSALKARRSLGPVPPRREGLRDAVHSAQSRGD
jgi:ATP-dependent DNA ligase